MPLALLAVGSAVERRRYDVVIVDGRLTRDPMDQLRPHLSRAVCLGITVLTGEPIADALSVSRAVKAVRPDLPVVWGGWHPSLFPEMCLQAPCVDVVVRGQGESVFARLVDRLSESGGHIGALSGLPGCSFRTSDGHTERDTRSAPNGGQDPDPSRTDIPGPKTILTPADDLPPHDYELIDIRAYFALKGAPQLDYVTSYGCFYRCGFCADPQVFGRRWTGLAPERVVAEVSGLVARTGAEDINFQDETFFTYPERAARIAQGLLDERLEVTWAATLRADQADRMPEATLATCRASGLRRVLIGVESGDQAMLDRINKDISLEQVIRAAERCANLGIAAQFPFILGLPGESDAGLEASITLARRLRRMHGSFETPIFYYKPYPGTPMALAAAADGNPPPTDLDGWSRFDIQVDPGQSVGENVQRIVSRLTFYQALARGSGRPWLAPLRWLARARCRTESYGLPLEMWLAGLLRSVKRAPRPRHKAPHARAKLARSRPA